MDILADLPDTPCEDPREEGCRCRRRGISAYRHTNTAQRHKFIWVPVAHHGADTDGTAPLKSGPRPSWPATSLDPPCYKECVIMMMNDGTNRAEEIRGIVAPHPLPPVAPPMEETIWQARVLIWLQNVRRAAWNASSTVLPTATRASVDRERGTTRKPWHAKV